MSIMKAAISWLKPRDSQKGSRTHIVKDIVAEQNDVIRGVASINRVVMLLQKLKVTTVNTTNMLGYWGHDVEYSYKEFTARIGYRRHKE